MLAAWSVDGAGSKTCESHEQDAARDAATSYESSVPADRRNTSPPLVLRLQSVRWCVSDDLNRAGPRTPSNEYCHARSKTFPSSEAPRMQFHHNSVRLTMPRTWPPYPLADRGGGRLTTPPIPPRLAVPCQCSEPGALDPISPTPGGKSRRLARNLRSRGRNGR